MATVTEAQRQELFATAFPKALKGLVRPDAPIATDFPFSTDIPQFMRTDPVAYYQENIFLRQLLSNDLILNILVEALQKALTEQDFRLVTQKMKGAMSAADKIKIDGMADNANNYSHPTTTGNRHIPTGGSSGKILKWASDGTAQWLDENSYTHPATSGSKHIPAGGSVGKILRWLSDGAAQWGDDVNTWRGIVNALTSSSTEDSLSAAMGKWLNENKANIASPAFSGGPTAPTPAAGDNSTRIATTAFVQALIAAFGGTGLLAQNGWWKFPGGLILQWGAYSHPNANMKIQFPIKFPAGCFAVMAVSTYDNSSYARINGVPTQTSCVIDFNVGYDLKQGSWIAFGM